MIFYKYININEKNNKCYGEFEINNNYSYNLKINIKINYYILIIVKNIFKKI